MRIKSVNIKNFKNISDLSYEPTNKTVALIGKNGKGKTSFREALYAGITGDFPFNCIKEGEDAASVDITLNDGTQFARIINAGKPNKVVVNGRTTTAKSLTEVIETKTGVNKEAARIVTSANVLESLRSDEFGDFILTYIPEKLDYDTVVRYIPGITKDIEDVLSDVIPAMPEKFEIDQLKKAYNYFMEERKIIKKEIAVRDARVKSFAGKEPSRSVADIEAELDEIAKKEGGQASAKTALNLYNIAVKNRDNAQANLIMLKKQIDEIDMPKPNPAELSNIESDIKSCELSISNAIVMLRTIEDNIAVFTNTLNNLDKPICPLSEKLICTTDKTKIKEELNELLKSNQEGLVIQKKIIEENNNKIESLKEKKAKYEASAKLYDKKVILNIQYENQRKNIPSLPEKPKNVEFEDFSEQKKSLHLERDLTVAYKTYLKELDELNILHNKYSILDFLCKTFEPKGDVMSSIVSHYMSVFESVCNARAKELKTGFEIKFIPEEGVTYLVKTSSSSDYMPYSSLSSGEKALSMFLLLDMLNTLSQFKVMMIDDLDKLDSDAFTALMKVIQSKPVQDSYDHIVICAVDHPDIVATLSTFSNIDYI